MSPVRRDRSSPSCARCYRMKKKCDRKVPSCSRCTQAQARCHGIYRSDKIEIPRSVVSHLESRLTQVGNVLNLRQPAIAAAEADNVQPVLLSIATTSFGSLSAPRILRNDPGIHYHSRLFYASERPPLKIPVEGRYLEEPPRAASRGSVFRSKQLAAREIPFWVATKLFDNYRKNVLPIYPCFLESDLSTRFKDFYSEAYSPESQSSDINCFIVSMVLAISSLSSKAQDFQKVVALSEALQRDALSHASFLAYTNFQSLQCLALVIQMALCLPYSANLWYMSGEAMRMAIALGLHQDTYNFTGLHSANSRLRRQLFWAIYRMERTIAIATGCPIAISDEHITTEVPVDTTLTQSLTERCTFEHFSRNIRLSQIQSEIHGIQYFDQALPVGASNYSEWMQSTERSIQTWQDGFAINGSAPEWALRAADRCRLLLYRPCSRNIAPDESCLRTACIVALRIINRGCTAVPADGLLLTYENVYDVFQASIVLIYVVGNANTFQLDSAIEEQAHRASELLHPLLNALAAWWPAIGDTAQYVEELRKTVLNDPDADQNFARSTTDANLLAELDFLVTQRRIHSVYHRNLEMTGPEEKALPEFSPASFALLSDELLQELIGSHFDFPDNELLASNDFFEIRSEDCADTSHFPGNGVSIQDVDMNSLAELDVLMRSVPACGYCRSSHVKCDQQFPDCGACTRSDRQCVYYDPVLQTDVQRSYVYQLYERCRSLSHENTNMQPNMLTKIPREETTFQNTFLPFEISDCPSVASNILGESSLDSLFFGSGSYLSYLKRALSLNPSVTLKLDPPEYYNISGQTFPQPYDVDRFPSYSVSASLFRLFANSVNVFYPTLKDQHLNDIMNTAYIEGSSLVGVDQDLFYLIIAIASSVIKDRDTGLPFTTYAYFDKATRHTGISRTNWLSMDPLSLLQRQLLLCVYILFNPGSGDLWRNLGFAVRFYFDLAHRPSEHDIDKMVLPMLFRTLYCLESQASIAFGRPSLLIIGDKLREDMMQYMSGTVEERIGIYFYRISVLKMQIHSRLLRLDAQQSTVIDRHLQQPYQTELEAWLRDWKSEVLSNIECNPSDDPQLSLLLDSWASLHYYHATILANQVCRTGLHNALGCYNEVIQATRNLIRYQRRSLPRLATSQCDLGTVPVFVMDWTIAHQVFSIGLELFVSFKPEGPEMKETLKIARHYISTLALIEGDVSMLSMGFSGILETLWNYGETGLDVNI